MRAWEIGDSTIDIELPIWPSKLLFLPLSGVARSVGDESHWLCSTLQPNAGEIAVPRISRG